MTIQCVVCRDVIGTKEPFKDFSVTHTYCVTCYETAIEELRERYGRPEERQASGGEANGSIGFVRQAGQHL